MKSPDEIANYPMVRLYRDVVNRYVRLAACKALRKTGLNGQVTLNQNGCERHSDITKYATNWLERASED